MRKIQSQRSAPASEDLIIDSASAWGIASLHKTLCYETTINALTLESDLLSVEHDSLKNDMIALSQECCELEDECSLERSGNEQLRSTIEALSHKYEELLVQESQKHQPSNETMEMQQMKQKLKNAAQERRLLEERVAALERESAETDSYIRVLERNKTENPALASDTSEWSSTRCTFAQNEQDPRSSKSLGDLPQVFPTKQSSSRSKLADPPSADKAKIIKEERRHRRRASLDVAVNFCSKLLLRNRDETGTDAATIRSAALFKDEDFIYQHSRRMNK
jgi:chromosome segregation ATPase